MFKDASMEMGICYLHISCAGFSGNEFDLLPKGCNKDLPRPCGCSEWLAEGIRVAVCLFTCQALSSQDADDELPG